MPAPNDGQALVQLYRSGKSIPEVAEEVGLPRSTVRYALKKALALRSRADGVRLAAHKISSAHTGRRREFTVSHKEAIKEARLSWGEANAVGLSVKPSGYVEHTRGPHKGRMVHVVLMEERIGRRIRRDEVVHHIDHNRSNNDINNLALMTRAAHTRLHRREERIIREAA